MDFTTDDWDEGEDDSHDMVLIKELGENFLKNLCKKASTNFLDKYGLISHQIDSYNAFINHGIQRVFDSIGEIHVEPGYDPSVRGDGEWKHASVKFGKVTLERPKFWARADGKECLDLWPRHARLQNMTYSSMIMVQTHVQIAGLFFEVYTKKQVRSAKFKTGIDRFVDEECEVEDKRDLLIGRIPVMVYSELCWKNGVDKPDCEFDHGGYFIVKGAKNVTSSSLLPKEGIENSWFMLV